MSSLLLLDVYDISIPFMFDYWADRVVNLTLLKNQMA